MNKVLIFLIFILFCYTNLWNQDTPSLEVTYIANEGFMVRAGEKSILIDALFKNGFNMYLVPDGSLSQKMQAAKKPFNRIDLILVTHRHGDHFNALMVTNHLKHNPKCILVAHNQVILRMKKWMTQYNLKKEQIYEINMEFNTNKGLSLNGIDLNILCLHHIPYIVNGVDRQIKVANLSYIVKLNGYVFFHMGDAIISNSSDFIKEFPFNEQNINTLFLNYNDRSKITHDIIDQYIKPANIIAMHIPPEEVATVTQEFKKLYPDIFIFSESMETKVFK